MTDYHYQSAITDITSLSSFYLKLQWCSQIEIPAKTCRCVGYNFMPRFNKKRKKNKRCRASAVRTGQAMHCASNQPCILVHRCHFQRLPPIQISQLGPEKKKTERRLSVNKRQCWYFSILPSIVQCEPAVAPWSPLHAKCISNKGKPDTGNTSLWLSGHFQHFSSNKEGY